MCEYECACAEEEGEGEDEPEGGLRGGGEVGVGCDGACLNTGHGSIAASGMYDAG